MRTFRTYTRDNFQICHETTWNYSINYSHHVGFYILKAYLSFNWKFVPLDDLHLILTPLSSASGNHKSILFFFSMIYFF